MKKEHLYQGASFVKVLCGFDNNAENKGCQDKGGNKWLFFKHKGSAGTGGDEITIEEEQFATNLAENHEQNFEGHKTRVVIGHIKYDN